MLPHEFPPEVQEARAQSIREETAQIDAFHKAMRERPLSDWPIDRSATMEPGIGWMAARGD